MRLEDMKADLATQEATTQGPDQDVGLDYDDQMIEDLKGGVELLERVKILLDFVGNPGLIRVLSKRERWIMGRLSGEIMAYLENVKPGLEEVD